MHTVLEIIRGLLNPNNLVMGLVGLLIHLGTDIRSSTQGTALIRLFQLVNVREMGEGIVVYFGYNNNYQWISRNIGFMIQTGDP